ncbi:hypothetical protein EDB81DRAFT_763933 [Dactylonectria macrodidyma]|uniref:Rhodopsin domain-containing protein n=1 Tax=Dactylonectria macrodidyma TaxID=307937 RepID=A0A9P9IU85_9HYPO|nr:hypothetical protein EDB81DRAFT_763933 [Dactylonectria macrodidyma]
MSIDDDKILSSLAEVVNCFSSNSFSSSQAAYTAYSAIAMDGVVNGATGPNTIHRWIIWTNLGLIAIVAIAFFFILVFQCYPVAYFWRQVYGDESHCIDKNVVAYSVIVHSIVSALSDWCLGLLPISLLWHVQINRRTKRGNRAGVVLVVRIPYVTHQKPSVSFIYVLTRVRNPDEESTGSEYELCRIVQVKATSEDDSIRKNGYEEIA